MGCTSSDSAERWREKMFQYESDILKLAELPDPYCIESDFIEVEMDMPLQVRVHRLVQEGVDESDKPVLVLIHGYLGASV